MDSSKIDKVIRIAIGALTIVFVVFRPSLRKKDPLNPSTPKLGLAQQRSVEREMSNLLVELSDMARQISGQLDTRAAKLEALMQEADKKIARLDAAACGGTLPVYDPNALPRTAAGNAALLKLPSFPRASRPLLDQYVTAFEKVLAHASEIPRGQS